MGTDPRRPQKPRKSAKLPDLACYQTVIRHAENPLDKLLLIGIDCYYKATRKEAKMNKTLENMTIEELRASWEVAYNYYLVTASESVKAELDAISEQFAMRVSA